MKVFDITINNLHPLSDTTGNGSEFTAFSNEPWLSIESDINFKQGPWVEIIYSASYLDKLVRPLLRCVLQDDYHDEILPAPVFGRALWRGPLPKGTQSLQISPANQTGSFSFKIESLRVMSKLEVVGRAFVKRPRKAVLGVLSRIGGYRYLARVNLRHAIGATPFADYNAWRQKRIRAYEPDGFDGVTAGQTPVVLICACDEPYRDWLRGFIQELKTQPYPYWRLHLTGTNSFNGLPNDERLLFGGSPDVSGNSLVITIPTGTRLAPYALSVLANATFQNPDADVFYVDSDKITPDGTHHTPKFIPDFDPLLFQMLDCLESVICARSRLMQGLAFDDFRTKLPGMNLPKEAFHHIPRVLVSLPECVNKNIPLTRLHSPFEKTGVPPNALCEASSPVQCWIYPILKSTNAQSGLGEGRVSSIIIPTKDQLPVFRRCIESIFKFSDMSQTDLVIVDNGSSEPDAVAYLKELETQGVKVLYRPEPFNFSRLCNYGAVVASADFLVFLNNDTEITHELWLERLIRFAEQPDVGAVGAKLLYANRRLQHGGVILGLDGRAGHFERMLGEHDAGYFGRLNAPHQTASVTGACLAVEAVKFKGIGGFDEINLPVDLNDIDLCLRLNEQGWKSVFVSDVVILHHESVSRSGSWTPDKVYAKEREYFKKRWIHELRDCPNFHPALTLEGFRPALG